MESRGYEFTRLPYSKVEVEKSSKFYAPKVKLYMGKDATEQRFKDESGSARIIQAAVHGVLDEQKSMYSSIVFSLAENREEDGFLQTYEIFNLNINADLVILSGCETGRGQLKGGEGIIGMSRAWLYAGAKALLISLWSVEDKSSSKLIIEFHKNLKEGLTKAEALRHAKLELMKKSGIGKDINISYSHPYYWAPFILVGNYR